MAGTASETGKMVKVTTGFTCVADWGNWNGCGHIHGDHREAMLCCFRRDLALHGNPNDDRWDRCIHRAVLVDDGESPVLMVDHASQRPCAAMTGQWLDAHNLMFNTDIQDEPVAVQNFVAKHIISCIEDDLEAHPPAKAVTVEMVATPLAAAMRQVMPQSMASAFPEPKPAEEVAPIAESAQPVPARRSTPKTRRTARAA